MRHSPDPSGAVLAVCGLTVESRIAAGQGVRTVHGGGRSDALSAAIEREVAGGIVAIVSFGVAGALIPSLQPGALIVAASIVGPAATHPVDAAWSRALLRRLPAALEAPLAGCDRIVAEPAEKSALHASTGASAVDMESHIAARIAAAHGLPFAALRAIADPLVRSLPPAALLAMRDDGRIDLPAVLRSLVRSPGQLPRLLRIGVDAQRALGALGEGRRLLGRGLGYLDRDELLVDVV